MQFAWDMTDMIVLLPWGAGHSDGDAQIRCDIERMGGEIAYAKPPQRPYANYGRKLEEATHELVLDGADATTDLPKFSKVEIAARMASSHGDIAAFIEPHIRTAYIPVVAVTDTPSTETRYFGRPWMPEDMEWPELDGDPMHFVMQVDLATLPQKVGAVDPASGLLLFFHGEEYDPDSQSMLVVVDTSKPGGLRDLPEGVPENPALAICEWKEVIDFPWGDDADELDGYEEYEDILTDFGGCTIGKYTGTDGVEYTEKDGIEKGVRPLFTTFGCDKLGGWPYWEQGNETPDDRDRNPMEYLMQIGHEGIILGEIDQDTINWPTWGRGHIFVSPATGEFKYVWACD